MWTSDVNLCTMSACGTLAFACTSLICAQKKKRAAGGMTPARGQRVFEESKLEHSSLKANSIVKTKMPGTVSDRKQTSTQTKKSKPDKKGEKKKGESEVKKEAGEAKKEKQEQQNKDPEPVEKKTPKDVDKDLYKTAEPQSEMKKMGSKERADPLRKAQKTQEGKSENDNNSEKVDTRLQTDIEPINKSIVDTVKVDDRLNSFGIAHIRPQRFWNIRKASY